MGPTDSKRPVQPPHAPAHGSLLFSPGYLASYLGDGDGAVISPHRVDARDDWESAWIDLGGEG